MKVLLLNPPVTRDVPQAPLALMMLHASVDGHHDVMILDLNFITDQRKLSSFQPDIVGISCMSFQRDTVLGISRKLKEDDLAIVVGGSHPTIAPKQVLKCSTIDYVIMGEGEVAFPRLLDALERGSPLNEVPNLGYKKNGKIRLNPVEQIEDLGSLPFPAYASIDMHRYKTRDHQYTLEVPYETSRGCPFKCIFCCVNRLKGSYRVMCLDRVFQDIERIAELYPRDSILLNLFDNNFSFSRKRTLEFCKQLEERPWHSRVNWMCATRADQVDESLAKEMSKAGLVKVFIGGEVGYDSGLRSLQKGISTSDIYNAVEACLPYGIRVEVGFIVGFPWEKRDDIRKTLSFAIQLEEMGASTGLYKCVPYVNTPLWKYLEARKIRIDTSNSSNFDFFSESLTFEHPYLEDNDLNSVVCKHLDHKNPS
jgi:anaerobic magnesium-protoporphyrin IX monomethyl ester cyclase